MAAERKIGDAVYRCDKLSAEEGLALYVKVNDVFGGDAVLLASVAVKTTRETALKTFVTVTMRNQLEAGNVTDLIKDLVSMCQVNGDPAIMGVRPSSIEDAVEVAWFAMEVQLRDFLSASLGSLGTT
ncbi:phage tail assembly chaperone [Methylorubrum sp. SB2]|uniref:phage tail assembly chaperone n=1 Tax=Methylorubrum subtropicum TaxID=3138812 RepID=UPI00313E44C1